MIPCPEIKLIKTKSCPICNLVRDTADKVTWREVVAILLAIASFFVLISPYFQRKFPYTHDGENHLARFANYKLAVKQGQIPPRFAPNLMNRYGYPVFNYNYPLANILSLPFSALKINYELTFKFLVVTSFLLGGSGLWLWQTRLGIKKKWVKALAVSLFYLNPFVINLVYVRGNIGEIMALNLLLWLGLLVEDLWQNKWTNLKLAAASLIFAAFLLAHNITALFGSVLLICYFGIRLLTADRQDKQLQIKGKQFLLWLFYGLGLSLWFWVPALAEKSLVTLDAVDITTSFSKHFPTFRQLLFSPLSFGFSYQQKVDSLSFALGKPQLLILAASLPASLVLWLKKDRLDSRYYLLLIVCWLLFVFQLPMTKSVWLLVPYASYIQFPWRLGLFLSFCISLFSGLLLEKLAKLKWFVFLFVFLLVLQLVSVAKFKPADYFHRQIRDYDAFAQSTTTMNENRPVGFEYKRISDWRPAPRLLSGKGRIIVENWTGSNRSYQLILEKKSIIVEPTANFAGWQTRVDGEMISYLDNSLVQGRIAYQLPQGEYQVRTRFTQQTAARLVGNWATLITLIILIVMISFQESFVKNLFTQKK